jgi:hypothetical protein
MKHLHLFGVGIVLIVLIGLTACGAKAVNPQSTSDASVQVSTSAGTPASGASLSATPTVDVNALILEKLQNHHSIDRVYGAKHTREEWNATLDRMIGYGAKISEDEKKTIIDYLLSKQ